MSFTFINPPDLARASGYSHVVIADGSRRLVALSGQMGLDADNNIAVGDFPRQFDQALSNLVTAVRASGGQVEDIIQLRYYVTDMEAYRANKTAIGESYRRHFGSHMPAATLIAVTELVHPDALFEIDGLAAIR